MIRTLFLAAVAAVVPVVPVTIPASMRPTIVAWDLTPQQIATTCASEIRVARGRVAALAALPAPWTFANTTLELENLNADLNDSLVAQQFLMNVAADSKVRAASQSCANDVASFGADETADPALYRHLLAARKADANADASDGALSTAWIEQFAQSGAGLAPGPRAEFVRLSKTLNDLELRFNANANDDKTTIEISKRDAAGLPPDFVAGLRRTSSGGYVVPVSDSAYGPFMDHERDAAARRRYFLADGKIAAPQNVVLLERAIAIRYRLAHLLGFPSWAAYQMSVRTDRSPAHILGFLDDLDAKLLPRARADREALAALKAHDLGVARATLEPWDASYYHTKLIEKKYALDEQVVKQYFPAPHTVAAILDIYQKLLGVRFTKVDPATGWLPSVTEYAVNDAESGRLLGTFYLDLAPRVGKTQGAFNDPILPVRRLADGSYRTPISAIVVGDWPSSAPGQPILLTHGDVTTFFHEFGHNMAALLAEVPYETLTQFQQDFVEAPSQMLENFTWNPTVLKQISANVATGKPLPDALIAKMLAARCASDRICNAGAATGQIMLSIVDLDYHTAGPKVDTTAVWARVQAQTTPSHLWPGTYPQATFTHLMGGYDAGYYVYEAGPLSRTM